MNMIPIKEAKNKLTAIIRAAENGERIVVTRNGKPVADIGPHKKEGGINFEAGRRYLQERGIERIFGSIPDDFDDPLPADFLIKPMP